MKIVIDIDDNLYTRLFDNGVDNYNDAVDMARAIRKGTPLPEHHGRIIDESQIKSVYYHEEAVMMKGFQLKNLVLDHTDAPTIIEADEGSDSE